MNKKKNFDKPDATPNKKKSPTGGGSVRKRNSYSFSNLEKKEKGLDKIRKKIQVEPESTTMRLNKYIANAGICARRKADEHIKNGEVAINGTTILEPGYRVEKKDNVFFNGKLVKLDEKKVYILMNKPKDYITTMDDPQERKTVMELVKDACKERIYPVGRLDRSTTGLLLLTNDGDLAKKLSHPSFKVKKIYHVVLDRNLSIMDYEAICKGVHLEDGLAFVDSISYVDNEGKNNIGIEIHIGKNRIVRRIFEHLGYKVERLDRVYYAGLTKKDLPRGRYRFLSQKEVIMLKHFI